MSTETDAQLNALKEEIAAVRAENEKAWVLARDCYNALANAKTVGTNGKLGALSGADTLSSSPIGDANSLRSSISAMKSTETLMSIPVGAETWKFRQLIGLGNDKPGRDALGLANIASSGDYVDLKNSPLKFYGFDSKILQPYNEKEMSFVEAKDENSNPAQGWHLPTTWCNVFYASGYNSNNAIGIATGQGPAHEYWISGRDSWGNGAFRTWSKVLHSNNTSVDSNGFIKTASPIFRVGEPEVTETGSTFVSSGYGSANEEARGVSCERVSEGVYKITGSLGFADDNLWTIETPLDDNNQPILWVETSKDETGVITLKTYHRENINSPSFAQNKVEGKIDGEHIDIPSGRWIDLRLKMPEKKTEK